MPQTHSMRFHVFMGRICLQVWYKGIGAWLTELTLQQAAVAADLALTWRQECCGIPSSPVRRAPAWLPAWLLAWLLILGQVCDGARCACEACWHAY